MAALRWCEGGHIVSGLSSMPRDRQTDLLGRSGYGAMCHGPERILWERYPALQRRGNLRGGERPPHHLFASASPTARVKVAGIGVIAMMHPGDRQRVHHRACHAKLRHLGAHDLGAGSS
jgi:hypothetical protein